MDTFLTRNTHWPRPTWIPSISLVSLSSWKTCSELLSVYYFLEFNRLQSPGGFFLVSTNSFYSLKVIIVPYSFLHSPKKFQPILMFDNYGRVNEKWPSFDGCTSNINVLTMLILWSSKINPLILIRCEWNQGQCLLLLFCYIILYILVLVSN